MVVAFENSTLNTSDDILYLVQLQSYSHQLSWIFSSDIHEMIPTSYLPEHLLEPNASYIHLC